MENIEGSFFDKYQSKIIKLYAEILKLIMF